MTDQIPPTHGGHSSAPTGLREIQEVDSSTSADSYQPVWLEFPTQPQINESIAEANRAIAAELLRCFEALV